MTDMNLQLINENAQAAFRESIQQIEEELITDEKFIGTLYGNMVAAATLGWDIQSMVADAIGASDRVVEAIENAVAVNETVTG